ncbi:hypothetical protein Gasu2_34980 [Galdieria sulphuraria]|uniref:Uncharacterized protein n=1 Tax=Galdieria sulphuraria TaxID=130081 RepID=M2XVH6_GALSU|nr:uncharacterized protein Gasu_49970 [Galdieria sulphuraria]EME27399.1 hypothetical protein Gasu_49970 [Galdieria sulphuraria]GJD09236.1 hypothetical protein Gasu2_34980 [Galdieria sulphuraria]|eukprot:XP_005703919.1 hypothetical protein Gasu_49970 [Galdieria sulphuraria]
MRWTLQSYLVVALTATVAAGFTTILTKYKSVFSMLRARWFRDVFEDLRLRLRASEAAAIRERLDLLEAKILSSETSNLGRLSVHSPRTLAEEKPTPEWELVTREDFVTLRSRVDNLAKSVNAVKSQANKSLQVSEDMLRQYLENAVSTKEQLTSFSQGASSLLEMLQQLEKAFNSLFYKLDNQDSSKVLKAIDAELSNLRSFVEDVNEEVKSMRLVVNQANVTFSNSSVFGRESEVPASWREQEKKVDSTTLNKPKNTLRETSIDIPHLEAEGGEEDDEEEEKGSSQPSPNESGETKKKKKKKKKRAKTPQPTDATS